MQIKPDAKPLVSCWLNPLANCRLTPIQNNTKQNKVGFGSLNQNQNPPYVLVGQPYKQGFFSCFFSSPPCLARLIRATAERFSTAFQHGFQQSGELGAKA